MSVTLHLDIGEYLAVFGMSVHRATVTEVLLPVHNHSLTSYKESKDSCARTCHVLCRVCDSLEDLGVLQKRVGRLLAVHTLIEDSGKTNKLDR